MATESWNLVVRQVFRTIRSSVLGIRTIAVAIAIGVLAIAASVWRGAVERWMGQELRSLAAVHLNPTFIFDDLIYTLARTIVLRGVRLTSPDPESTTESIAMDSLTAVLSNIPRPDKPFQMQRLDLVGPTLRLVRTRSGQRQAACWVSRSC